MKIKKIKPPRKFYPTNSKKLCLKDTLHISVSNGETYNINKKINLSIKKWGFQLDNHLDKDFYFMGSRITDHLIHVKNKNKLKKYCKDEKQEIILFSTFLSKQK